MAQPKGYVDAAYLEFAARIVRPVKQRTYERMRVEPGHRVLDVGCGVGLDTIPLAQTVGPSGQVVGIDYDEEMVAQADLRAAQAGVSEWVRHECGDALSLPFESNGFDSARSERVFQHLTEPKRALAEMVRVTKPGGWIVVLGTDWSTLSIDTPEFEIEQALKRARLETMYNPTSGRQLYRLFKQQNLLDVSIEMCPIYITHLAIFRQGTTSDRIERHALESGMVTPQDLDRWHQAQEQADALGVFFASVDQVLLAGRKP